ncbi:hypothetical protein VCHC52A1_0895, partial [Vibrio cholerae HC-52A1]
MAAAPANT